MGVGIFSDPTKYNTPSNKALAFLKSQMRSTPAGLNGRLPVSYLITGSGDPGFNNPPTAKVKDRCWIYDTGLALLVFTASGDYSFCQSIMNRLVGLQNTSVPSSNPIYGSFDDSYDFKTGKVGGVDIHTGNMGWLVWGMCYYALKSGNHSYNAMIEKAGGWLLNQEIKNNPNYPNQNGLLKFGYTYINGNYVEFSDRRVSTEHQCSALQALQGLAALFPNDTRYAVTAANVKEWFLPTKGLWNESVPNNKRYNEGYNNTDRALDCTTWAGATVMSLSIPNPQEARNIASACRSTAARIKNFLVMNENIGESYNGHQPLSSPVTGFKAYPPQSLIWTEGTLGYIHLCMLLGENDEAINYMDNTIKLQNCTGSTGGIIYATKNSGEFQVRECVVSSAWLYLLINNPNILFPNLTNFRITGL